MKRLFATLPALLGLFAALCAAPYALSQEDDEPTPPKKTRKAKNEEESASDLPAVPAALKGKEYMVPAKLNTKAKVYFIYKSRFECGICVAELPGIVDAYKRMKGKKAELVMINIGMNKEDNIKWLKKSKVAFPVVAENQASDIPFPYEYGENSSLLPNMVAVDAEGNKIDQANGSDVATFVKDWKKVVKQYEKAEKKSAQKAKKASKKHSDEDTDSEEE